eukprot:PhM_4_TR478/c2_g1_i2/m.27569
MSGGCPVRSGSRQHDARDRAMAADEAAAARHGGGNHSHEAAEASSFSSADAHDAKYDADVVNNGNDRQQTKHDLHDKHGHDHLHGHERRSPPTALDLHALRQTLEEVEYDLNNDEDIFRHQTLDPTKSLLRN